jgi:hypothetical protein
MINAILQWTGAVAFIAMHSLNALGPDFYPYNIVCGAVGSTLFLAWTIRVANKPQLLVNLVGLVVCLVGLFVAK